MINIWILGDNDDYINYISHILLLQILYARMFSAWQKGWMIFGPCSSVSPLDAARSHLVPEVRWFIDG